MGYSCSTKASLVFDELIVQLQGSETNSQNKFYSQGTWKFYEIGREQRDGSITGSIMSMLDNDKCRRSGSFKVAANGRIVRFPGSTKTQRTSAEIDGLLKFYEIYGGSWSNDEVLPDYLKTASFIAV